MKRHLVAALALAVGGLLAAAPAEAAKKETAQQRISKAKKQRPQVRSPQRRQQAVKKPLQKAPQTAAATPSTDTESRISKPGDYSFAIQHAGRTRTYRVHVPPGYAATEPVPLVVALHGGAIDRQGSDALRGLANEADRQGFVVVFPDASLAPGKGGTAAWNAGTCCGAAHDQQVDDVGFIQAVVTNLFRQMSIARYRIYAAGMSDGGMMAYRLACELPDVFKAVASVGGTDNTATCTPGKPVSVLHIHARNDARVPFGGGPAAPAGDKTAGFSSVAETAAKWAGLNGCVDMPRHVLDQAGAFCEAYSYCRAQAQVQLCVTDTGGHSWPGAVSRRGQDSPSQAISATQAIWTFFNAQ